ncbi:MAG: exonuclease domain-containing protein [Candidatus Peregrinibacteria bacterium]|nr:exonuclease domain-containing protein [Candidatus Peregrinibacteria bacterium]
MRTLFLDTETTGIEPQSRLVQLAYKNGLTGEEVNAYFKPPVAISYGSMAVHHITNEMVADKPAFADSAQYTQLVQLLSETICVAHNAPFDVGILKNEGVEISTYIDTLRVSKHLIQSDQYNLQYLRYSLHLNTVQVTAHDAMGDVLVLEALFNHLTNVVKEKFSCTTDDDVISKMLELTYAPVPMTTFAFGKYKGKTFDEVRAMDRGYITWLHTSEKQKPVGEQNEDLMYTLDLCMNNKLGTPTLL